MDTHSGVKTNVGKSTQSLQVLPKNTVIQGKRKSQGGELVIISGYVPPKEISEVVGSGFPREECESDRRKGRVCIMGPLADTLRVKSLGDKQKGKEKAILKNVKYPEPPTLPPLPPTASFLYQEDKVGAVSLTPIHEKNVLRASHVSETTLRARKIMALATAANKMKPPSYQPNCTDIVRDLERNRAKIACQIVTGRDFKSEWHNPLPRDINTLPPHTVVVRWKCCYNLPCFTLESVHAVLSRLKPAVKMTGMLNVKSSLSRSFNISSAMIQKKMNRFSPIVTMAQLSPNSAIVVFKNENDAKMMVACRVTGFKNCPLLCEYLDKNMYHDRKVFSRFQKQPNGHGIRMMIMVKEQPSLLRQSAIPLPRTLIIDKEKSFITI